MPPSPTFAQRIDARVAEAFDRRLVDRMAAGGHRGLARLAAVALATPVHLVSIAVLAAAVYVVVRGDNLWAWAVGAFLAAVAWVTRPRLLWAPDPDSIRVDGSAPELVALVREVCELAGTRPPAQVRVDDAFNAYVGPIGIGQRQLVLGATLWAALGPQERVALLGHEIGHLAHGDLLSGQFVGGAYDTLRGWISLLRPDTWETVLIHAAMAPPRWLLRGYLHLLVRVNATSSRSQELYADLFGAVAAGTDAAASLHEVTLLAESLDVVANRAAMDRDRPHIGVSIADRVASYDAAQRAGNRRAAAEDERRTDASHPPTVDRLRLVESVERSIPAIVVDAARSRRIDQQLQPALDQAFKRLGDAYRYVH